MTVAKPIDRRTLLRNLAWGGLVTTLPACSLFPAKNQVTENINSDHDWQHAEKIRQSLLRPEFPNNVFSLKDYCEGGDQSDCTEAFRAAITACNQGGGGRVLVPAGEYQCGPIHLLSNVNLHLEKGALIKFIPEPERYLPPVFTRWEGLELMGYSPLIYAYGQENIAITGEGTLDGSANNKTWWPWKGPHKEAHWQLIPGQDQKNARNKLMDDAEQGVPVVQRHYADGAYLRPPMIQPYQCKKVLVEGITIKDSPFWLLNPVLCQHVSVSNVTFNSHGPNSDGCNPESCDHVLIENCLFDTGDDCIAIKSGRNADGRRLNIPSKNILIANCMMRAGHGGVVIGSEISGGVNNVFVENCIMDSPDLERAIRIKTNSVRGGVIEHLRYRNITVGQVQTAVVINFYYEEGDAGSFDPVVRDIVVENLKVQQVLIRPFNLQGFERTPIRDLHFVDCHFLNQSQEPSIVKNLANVTFENVSINGEKTSPEILLSLNND